MSKYPTHIVYYVQESTCTVMVEEDSVEAEVRLV